MKISSTKTLVAAIALSLAATSASASGKLSIYHWFEYMPQQVLDDFKAKFDIEVTMDTYDSNESLLASLKAGKIGSYDLAFPGDYMVAIMANQGLLDTYQRSELSNFDNIQKQWIDVEFDKGRKSSIPYQWGTTSFSVNRDVYSGSIDSTAIIFDPPKELRGKINVLDSQGEVLTMASLHLGIPQCSTDRKQLKKLNDLLLSAKAQWASFGSDTAKEVLVSGDAAAGMIYNGYSAKAKEEGANVEYAYPKEGYVAWMDNVVLLRDAPNRASAITFMNYMLEPEVMGKITNFSQYSAGIQGVAPFLTEKLRNSPENNPPASAPVGTFVAVCDEQTQLVYDRIWTNLKK
ncbi:MAG: extracellular solute-binding protein [Pseudomonadales bacterium]|nr:extracellular solute-binding protein [Pseudomonadales bacterium]NRA14655.1 extracellular solute-binding protein [Oceanospirillaceae bacterium]